MLFPLLSLFMLKIIGRNKQKVAGGGKIIFSTVPRKREA